MLAVTIQHVAGFGDEAVAEQPPVGFRPPQMRMEDGTRSDVEALIRWQHAQHGLIGPGRFTAVAEAGGLNRDISRRMLHETVRIASTWSQPVPVAINISPRELEVAETPDGADPVLPNHPGASASAA